MTVLDSPPPGTLEEQRAAAVEQQVLLERGMIRSIIRNTIFATPVAVAVVVGMMALAISSKQPWYVWVSLGVGMALRF